MKYIRTKDGRIIKENDLDSVENRKFLILRDKKTNQLIATIEFECFEKDINTIEDLIFAEYCKTNELNILNIKRERKIIFNDILKQANTIEELCDEFVIEYPNGGLDTLNHDYSEKLKYMCMEQYNAEINHGWCKLYGAIWTDKGLIYVAKMNEKGELELL